MRTARRILVWIFCLALVAGLFFGFALYQERKAAPAKPKITETEPRSSKSLQIWGNRDPVPNDIRADRRLLDEGGEHTEFGPVVFGGDPRPGGQFPDPCPLQVLHNVVYVVGYCDPDGGPHWSAYRLARVSRLLNQPREDQFYPDARVKNPVVSAAYTGSGFDRGHMTPHYAIATHFPLFTKQTFLLTNILPQAPSLNRGLWADLERLIVTRWAQSFHVWVITGPIYTRPARKLAQRVTIPSHFYHLIFRLNARDEVTCLAFIFPQQPAPGTHLEDYLVTLAEVETRTGLEFAPALNPAVRAELAYLRGNGLWGPN